MYVWEITGEKGRVTGEGQVPDTFEGDLLSRGTQQDVYLKEVRDGGDGGGGLIFSHLLSFCHNLTGPY